MDLTERKKQILKRVVEENPPPRASATAIPYQLRSATPTRAGNSPMQAISRSSGSPRGCAIPTVFQPST